MRTEFLCISVLRIASGPRVKLASCKSALNPWLFTRLTVLRRWSRCYLLSVALWFILRGSLCFSYIGSICACLVLSFSSSSWCLGRAGVCDCDIPWTFLLPLFFLPSEFSPHKKNATSNKVSKS